MTGGPGTARLALAGGQITGTAYVLAATVAWSLSGTFTRLLTTDMMTAIVLRSFFGGLFLFLPFVAQHGRSAGNKLLRIGWPGLALTFAQVVCQASTVGAFYRTSIANVAVIYATAPFMAAGLAYWLVGERMAWRTVAACVVSFLGVIVIVSNGFGSGHFAGDLTALLMTVSFALIIVIPRAYPRTEMLPATILSAGLTVLVFLPFAHLRSAGAADWLTLAAFGFNNFTVAMYFFLAGSRRIAAAQAALIGTLEIVLSPLWAWLIFNEHPGRSTVIGGGLIMAVVIWHTWRDLSHDRTAARS